MFAQNAIEAGDDRHSLLSPRLAKRANAIEVVTDEELRGRRTPLGQSSQADERERDEVRRRLHAHVDPRIRHGRHRNDDRADERCDMGIGRVARCSPSSPAHRYGAIRSAAATLSRLARVRRFGGTQTMSSAYASRHTNPTRQVFGPYAPPL